MKKNTRTLFTLSYLFLACSPAVLAGGVEVSPVMWDFYIGGSGVGYGYEHRINAEVARFSPTPFTSVVGGTPFVPVFPIMNNYRDFFVSAGFDIGVGVWGDRGYFGIEGRYDFGRITAQDMTVTSDNLSQNDVFYFANVEEVYSAKLKNNASIVAKIGYQLLPRTMTYILFGWARTTYVLSDQLFSFEPGKDAGALQHGTTSIFAGVVYKKSLNGGTVGCGLSQLLVDGLSIFAEFAVTGYHMPSIIPAVVQTTVGSNLELLNSPAGPFSGAATVTNILSSNYYHYNLRVGLNWSFASLM